MDNRLTIELLNGRYTLPRGHPQPERVRARLDDVALKEGAAVMARLLGQTLPADDPGVWLIRRLDCTLLVDAGALDPDALARLWGRHVAQAVAGVIARGPDGRNVLRFADRAAYVTQYVADLVEGAAANKWYYADFAGLKHLPVGPAIREAIMREGDLAVVILHRLALTSRLERVLRVLAPTDCAQLVAILPDASPAPARAAWARVLSVWSRTVRRENGRYATAANQLRLWLAAHESGSQAIPDLSAITHMLNLADLLIAMADPVALIDDVARGEFGTAVTLTRPYGGLVGLESLPAWQQAAGGDRAWLAEVAMTLAPPGVVRPASSSGSTFATAAGGLFLLLPIVLDLDLFDLLSDATHEVDASHSQPYSNASHWLYWLMLKCLGGARAGQWRDDRALLLAVGLDDTPAAPVATTPAQLAELRREWRSRLRYQGRADGRFLALEEAEAPGSPVFPIAVLRDMRHDYWLDVGPPDEVQVIVDQLQQTIDGFRLLIGNERPDWPAEAVPDYAAKAKPVSSILDYFTLPTLPPVLDVTLTVLAQGVMRTFARHLLGFAWSSPAYLYDNFLAGDGLLTLNDDEIRVQLPAGPLHSILRLTGQHEQRYTLPWLPDRVIQLTG